MGYCILGISCNVDSDFVEDDLGGHCNRLSEAFNPKANFVCCKQNPANFEGENNLEAVILETNLSHDEETPSTETEKSKRSTTLLPQTSTDIVTEMITELQTQTERVTKVEEVTKVVTQIITEIVNENDVRYQDEYDIPEDWNEPAEGISPSADNLMSTNEAFSENIEKYDDQSETESEFTPSNSDTWTSLNENTENIDRMDVNVIVPDEDYIQNNDQYNDFLPSLGAPSSFSSVLNAVPDILASPWVEVSDAKPNVQDQPAPTWSELQTFSSNQDKEVFEDADAADENIKNWDDINVVNAVNEIDNSESLLSPVATNSDGVGQGLVYEFEIGQTIQGGESFDGQQDIQASILRPGVVIDDPTLLESIVSTSFVNVEEENESPIGSIVEVDLEEDYGIYPQGPIVEIEAVPLFENIDHDSQTDFNADNVVSDIFYEPIGINDAIEGENIDDSIQGSPDKYIYYDTFETESTSKPNEPELHCDLSILLNGISCSFKVLDKEEVRTQPPLKYAQVIDRSDDSFRDYEETIISRPGLFEIPAPVQEVGTPVTIATVSNEDIEGKNTEFLTANLPSAVPALEPPTVSQKLVQDQNSEVKESENEIFEFDESSIDIKLPNNILETKLGEVSKEELTTKKNSFVAKIKKNYRDAGSGVALEQERDSNIELSLLERDYEPRKEDNDNPVATPYHLNNLHEDAQLLQLFIEQIERTSNITLVNATLINKPFSDQDINTVDADDIDEIESEPESEPEPSVVKDSIEESMNIDVPFEDEVIATSITVSDLNTTNVNTGSSFNDVLNKETIPNETFEEGNIVSLQNVTPKPKNHDCGIKGGKSVEQAYGKEASKYIMPLLIDSWVFGKDKEQKARFEDTEARVIGGKVTSTVLYCWVAAILTEDNEFVCTGTLVTDDLVLTSGSCINFLFKRGLKEFKVVLGDSNLKVELQFGVQEHKIMQALVHEDYDINDEYHQHDIGFVILRTPARLEDNVCLLCLPRPHTVIENESCTVTGYGKPSLNSPIPRGASYWEDKTTDGILREAELDILMNEVCSDYMNENVVSNDEKVLNTTNLVCAGSNGKEQACFVAMDGGSPLACESDGHHYLAGMVTFGTACGKDSTPSVFVRVAEYVEWILRSYAALRPRSF